MIPLQLQLTNFLSYRNTATLAFDDIQLACISGQNGAGKSSVLEAITWSLFGKSRSRSDDDIVNRRAALQSERAEVRFTFDLNGLTYRVIRRKKRGGRTGLEFQMERTAGNWTTLTESKMRATQAQIERTLKMNYDTFVNVSFFLQGKADEFTTKTSGRRKEILAELLGVDRWDAYKERAGEARKSAEHELLLLDARIKDIDDELLTAEERAANLEASQAELDKTNAQLKAQEILLRQLRQAADAVKRQKQEVTRRKARERQDDKRLRELQSNQQRRQRERDQHQQILDQREAIEAAETALVQAQAEFEVWQAKANTFNRLQRAMQPHELAIARERSRLTQRQNELNRQAQRAEKMTAERETLTVDLGRKQDELADLTKQSAEIQQHETAYYAVRDEVQQLKSARQLLKQEARQLQRRLSEIGRLRTERDNVQSDLLGVQARLTGLQAQLEKAQTQRSELTTIQTRLNHLVTSEQPRLKAMIDRLTERIKRVEAETGENCPICGRALTAEHKAAVIAEIKQEGKPVADDYRANKRTVARLSNQQRQLEEAVKNAVKLERDYQAQQKRVAICEARLSEIGRVMAEWDAGNYEDRLTELQVQMNDTDDMDAKQRRVGELQRIVDKKPALERARRLAQQLVLKMEARSAEIERTLNEWQTSGVPALAEVVAQLNADNFEANARAALNMLNAELVTVGYDAAAHQQAKVRRHELVDVPQQVQGLKSAEIAVKTLNDTLTDLVQQVGQQAEQLEATRQELADSEAQLVALQADEGDLKAAEDEAFILREKKSHAERRVGVAQQNFAILDTQRQARKDYSAERHQLTIRIQRLQRLEKACGRDGVQALLIEHALPEIEDSANKLLDKLSNGEMRITFETQKQLKTKKELRETLDIVIMDGNGDRPYENYSGGEQFRINFAIRLALSKILSQRAGARLQTLVIDEGFGSQDPNGRQRLIEAINAIQNDFECILVITHIDELREAFPSRIEVTKSADGSQLRVR